MSEQHFFIAATPRTATAWLATFLDYRNVSCQHEGLARVDNFETFCRRLENDSARVAGESGTLVPMLWEPLQDRFPRARWILIRREAAQIASDFAALGVRNAQCVAADCVAQWERMAAGMPDAIVLEFAGLFRENVMRGLWDWVTQGEVFPLDRWERMRELQIQIAPWEFLPLLAQRTPLVQGLLASVKGAQC